MNERNAPDLAAHFAADLEADDLRCRCDGATYGPQAHPFIVHPDCPEHSALAPGCPVPDPAPSIPAHWDLITAGDGRNYERLAPAEGAARWRQVGYHWRLNTAEILAMGDVRRAAVITLPDEVPEFDEYLIAGPEKVKTFAAELFAAALHAEEGDR